MVDSWYETWTTNSFAGLLTDAISFDIQAQKDELSDFPTKNRYAKAAGINSVLSIEAGANSCLARMTYPTLVVEQLDKLPVLDKYDVLFTARYGKAVDRGSKPFQVVKELFQLRNRYVHPKLKKVKTKIVINEAGDKTYEKLPEQQKLTPILKVPYDLTTWTHEHSRIVVRDTINFFNHFFSELCGLSKEDSSKLLSVFVKGPVNTASFLTKTEIEILKQVKHEYKQDVKFLAW